MSLKDLLPNSVLGYKGEKPPSFATSPTSTLHYESSINNRPQILRVPSVLDLDGKKPEEYKNTAPAGSRV